MKVFAISDLHLSINNPKPMDIFGPVWEGYLDTIIADWNEKVDDDDIVLIPGDISWAMRLNDAKPDLDLINSWKGNKVLLKGNHDYWWSSISEIRKNLTNKTFAIQNDAVKFDNVIICGSRGWVVPNENGGFSTSEDEKIYRRELIRMELSLKNMAAIRKEGDKVIVMTHYPPYNYRFDENEMILLFEKYNVDKVVFGHLHSFDKRLKLEFTRNGVEYYLTSCDLVQNKLVRIV